MSEQRPPIVVVQQSQQQTQGGCCSGAGCGWFVLICIALFTFAMVAQAIQGEAPWWWIPVGSIGALIVLFVGFAAIDHWLGLGILERVNARMEENRERRREEGESDTQNYGTPERERWGQRVSYPDDPSDDPPGEAVDVEEMVVPPAEDAIPRPDVYEQMRRLAELRDEGVITLEEFEAKKRDLLDRI